ncbi:quinone reductase Qor [Amycolatopsis mediterranei S699]|uniref:Quinone reductase Qor n=1 Tax=Amycolatopsis mediterranei (strain S699) TaxID=713604 RepID=A0A9R0UF06_AMYMS|nr:quinone reductase Qor [Amycolatopsis mediterranei S699]
MQHGTGGPEVLNLEDRPEPTRKAGEVLIRVEAIAVPFYETQLRAGLIPTGSEPAIFGHEAAGTVVEADDPAARRSSCPSPVAPMPNSSPRAGTRSCRR